MEISEMSAWQKLLAKSTKNYTPLEAAVVFLSGKHPEDADNAADELEAKNKAIESAIKALRAVTHDRPTAHTDDVWQSVCSALAELETLK